MRYVVGAVLSICCALGATLPSVRAQTGKWPEKPVRLILASPPGSGDDFVARAVTPRLAELLPHKWVPTQA